MRTSFGSRIALRTKSISFSKAEDENGEYYNSHKDISVVSQLTWLYHEPKMFTGGNVIFSDMNETIECLHNRSVFFPGHYQHEVQEVNMNDNFKKDDFDNQYYGRFSIANFFSKISETRCSNLKISSFSSGCTFFSK